MRGPIYPSSCANLDPGLTPNFDCSVNPNLRGISLGTESPIDVIVEVIDEMKGRKYVRYTCSRPHKSHSQSIEPGGEISHDPGEGPVPRQETGRKCHNEINEGSIVLRFI